MSIPIKSFSAFDNSCSGGSINPSVNPVKDEASMISPKQFAKEYKQALAKKVAFCKTKPKLTVHQVGNVEASNRYINGKMKDCEEVGIAFELVRYPETVTVEEVNAAIKARPDEAQLVQLPVPFDEKKIVIPPEFDVDGFSLESKFDCCTPRGIMLYLKANGVELAGKHCVVIGRSDIVGKPMAKLMLKANATVTVCHSRTPEALLKSLCRNADIIVSAVGKAKWLNIEVENRPIIIDVGINFDGNGKMCGDVGDVRGDVRYITPVPGGVGLLTRIALLGNVYDAFNKENQND